MFARFARFISQYWIWVLGAWIVVALGLKLVAPKWDDIIHDGDFAYLPASMPSVQGEKLIAEDFPEETAKSQIAIVVARPDGRLTHEDKAVVDKLAKMLMPTEGEKSPVLSVSSYRPDDPVGRKLISRYDSKHGQAALVTAQLTTELLALDNMGFIRRLYEKVHEVETSPGFPDKLQLGVTGSAPVGADMLYSMKESIDNTELATVALVIAILLIVYRAPALVLIPLISIAVSYFVALQVIALVAQWAERHTEFVSWIGHCLGREQFDYQVFTTTQIFIVVVLFGAATDYCLFLLARYREEMERGLGAREALEEALGQTGHALVASAMTTILGLGAMIFADFGKYRSGGPTIALSLVVALAACMTVAPALLRAMGRYVFWPFGVGRNIAPSGREESLPREQVGGLGPADKTVRKSLVRQKGPTVMARFWAMIARQVVAHPGLILIGAFVVLAFPAWKGLDVPVTYDMLAELNPNRDSVKGMELLRQYFPIGETGPIVVLADWPGGNFDSNEQRDKLTQLAMDLNDFTYVDRHGVSQKPIQYVRCLSNPLGEPSLQDENITKRFARLRNSHTSDAKRRYLSSGEHLGEATRIELVTDYDPFSRESIDLLGAVDKWLEENKANAKFGWDRVTFDFVGTTAQIRDLDAVNNSDMIHFGHVGGLPMVGGIFVYVTIAVLVVLLFVIRRPVVSLYLIFTVIFGYLVSLGLTHLFFGWLYGDTYRGLDWKLKIFLFVILVAVGEDYNIYLVTRVFEEQRKRGPLDGLREAVARTGGIITSCGVIMAGTFGSMATGTLRSMIELGFAMSLGVLLDTFIIRTILVPAFLALLARRSVGSAVASRSDVVSKHYDKVAGPMTKTSEQSIRGSTFSHKLRDSQ